MTLYHPAVFTSVMEESALPIFKAENEVSRFLQNVINHLQDYKVNFHWHENVIAHI
jgi:hypothetical protein